MNQSEWPMEVVRRTIRRNTYCVSKTRSAPRRWSFHLLSALAQRNDILCHVIHWEASVEWYWLLHRLLCVNVDAWALLTPRRIRKQVLFPSLRARQKYNRTRQDGRTLSKASLKVSRTLPLITDGIAVPRGFPLGFLFYFSFRRVTKIGRCRSGAPKSCRSVSPVVWQL